MMYFVQSLSRTAPLPSFSLALALASIGCSGGDEKEKGGDSSEVETSVGAIDGDALTTSAGDSTTGNTYGGRDENGECHELSVSDGCTGEVYEGESVPLDLYLMFDQSGSMATKVDEKTGETRIEVVRAAVQAFLEDEESVGMGAGIGYFGHQPLRETTCDPADYQTPDVEIGSLPGLTEELNASLEAAQPTGETPTGAAIRGACDYVAGYKKDHGGRNPAILLVTDGEPKAPLSEAVCAPTLEDAVEAAEECYQEKGIRVYVLGVGPSLTNLRVIAEAGGTSEAFLADKDNKEQVLEAFRAVRYAAQLPCELAVNEEAATSRDIDFDASTVAYLDFECNYAAISEVSGAGECADSGGWYFDDAEQPSRIILCDATCGDVKSKGRQLFYSIGCDLQFLVR